MTRMLLMLSLFVFASACGGGGGNPSPTSPTTPTVPNPPAPGPAVAASWQGTLTAVRRTLVPPLDTTQSFAGTATFERGDVGIYEPPDLLAPLVPPNAATYILKPGLLKLTHTGSIGPCSYGTGTWDVLMKANDGYLIVAPGGTVTGRITLPETLFPVTVTCPTGSTQGDSGVQMDLTISGSVTGTRITGTMTPATVAGTTFSGSWSFDAR